MSVENTLDAGALHDEKEAIELLAWLEVASLPTGPFELRQGLTVIDPAKMFQSVKAGLAKGPIGPRWEEALRDARRLREIADQTETAEAEIKVTS
jgi:hypothetical protein